MAGKFFFIDTTRCTACRGCQVACKQWNKNRADHTTQVGTYQNPLDLDGETFRLVRFAEHPRPGGGVAWYFFSDACRHCLEPWCKARADRFVPGAIVIEDSGAVVFTEKTRELEASAKVIKQACPWSIPNWSERKKQLTKCDMCHDRLAAGLEPACVAACPTGALNFGEEGEMKELAVTRQALARKKFGQAHVLDAGQVRALYLVTDELRRYMKSSA